MKALVLTTIHEPLTVQEWPKPQAKPGYAIVQIVYAAINHRDVWIRKGQYAGIKVPIILGSDGAGLYGEREVMINPSLQWGREERYQSADYEIVGLPNHGTFAEYIAVPESQIFDKPSHLSLAEAAALPLAGLTAYRALFVQAKLKKGDKVLITGIGGGVAAMALQMARANGNEVWVSSSSTEKLEAAKAQGAQNGALYTDSQWFKDLKADSGGFDVVIDGAGGPGFGRLVAICNPGARIAIYGGTAGAIQDLSPQQIFWKQVQIIGSTMGSDKDFARFLAFVTKHKMLPPISAIYPLEQGNEAFDLMEAGKQNGKIILKMNK